MFLLSIKCKLHENTGLSPFHCISQCLELCLMHSRPSDMCWSNKSVNTIRLTHLSPASRSSSTVRGCYASATNTQGTQKCLEMTTYLAEKELQNIQSDQCGWKKEHQLPAVTSALFLMSLKFISYVGVKSQKLQYLRSTIPSICHVGWFGWHGSQSLCSL